MTNQLPPDTEPHPANESIAIRAIAMPRDTNPSGDIFGGWLVSQMDLAAGSLASILAEGRCVTIAIDSLTFHKPVFVGDQVTCYANLVKIGKTSLTIKVDVWVRRTLTNNTLKVTEGTFVFVAIDDSYHPRVIKKR